ncbi:MAG: hypothetical protein ACFFE8_17280 [Candidatus Heimdallarchaeota archaeon]
MAKKSGIGDLGILLALIGGILMAVFGILRIVGSFMAEVNDLLQTLFDVNFVGGFLGENGGLISGAIALLLGVIVIWAWRTKQVSSGNDLLLWGIIYIVLGLIGGSLGGMLVLLGGILFVIDYLV